MNVEACTKFYQEKHAQAAKVFSERYGCALTSGEKSIVEWAEESQPELYAKLRASEREVDALWENGVFDEDFKVQVLIYLRTWLELCRVYAAEIKGLIGRAVA